MCLITAFFVEIFVALVNNSGGLREKEAPWGAQALTSKCLR